MPPLPRPPAAPGPLRLFAALALALCAGPTRAQPAATAPPAERSADDSPAAEDLQAADDPEDDDSDEEEGVQIVLGHLPTAAGRPPLRADRRSYLVRHVGSPAPGQASLALGLEKLLPLVELRLPFSDWVRLDVQLQFDTLAPLLDTQLRLGAGGPHGRLWPSLYLGAGLRPLFELAFVSGARLHTGLGLGWQAGRWLVSADGGLLLGLAFNPIDERDRLVDLVDQAGGLYTQQRLEVAVDLFDRVQLAGAATLIIPLSAVALDQQNNALLTPQLEARLGARLILRF